MVAAIEAGKHIFVEKPLCQTDEEFEAITNALAQASSDYAFIQSYPAAYSRVSKQELRRRVSRGEIGEIYYVEGDYDYGRLQKILSGWRADIPFYSVVHGGAIHIIDLLLWLTCGTVDEVFAFGNKIATGNSSFRHYDMVVALLKFSNGLIAKITANFASVAPHHHKMSVFGTKATFEQSHVGAAYFHSRDPDATPELIADAYPGTDKGDLLPSFVAHILDGSPMEVTTWDVLSAMAVSLAIERSLSSGKSERVSPFSNK